MHEDYRRVLAVVGEEERDQEKLRRLEKVYAELKHAEREDRAHMQAFIKLLC